MIIFYGSLTASCLLNCPLSIAYVYLPRSGIFPNSPPLIAPVSLFSLFCEKDLLSRFATLCLQKMSRDARPLFAPPSFRLSLRTPFFMLFANSFLSPKRLSSDPLPKKPGHFSCLGTCHPDAVPIEALKIPPPKKCLISHQFTRNRVCLTR